MKSKQTQIIFTPAQLQVMSASKLRALLHKAEQLGVQQTVNAVTAELSERPLRAGGKVARKHVSVIKQVADAIVRVQLTLAGKFNMEAAFAGTPHAHAIVSSTGGAKAGGDMLAGKLLADYYASYRNGDNIASFGILLAHNDDLPHLEVHFNGAVKQYPLGQFDEAAAQYAVHIANIAPARAA